MNRLNSVRAVLFDLDGTFADTAPDLAFALNKTLIHFGRPELTEEAIRPVVSHGGIALIRLGFGLQPDDPGFEDRRQYLLKVYLENICRRTRLFDGMEKVLEALTGNNIYWGIVTNKPSWLTDPLVEALDLTQQKTCIVSGDTCAKNKPHPMPVLHACDLLGVEPGDTVYVGDAKRDMEAGKAAGTSTVCALFGYIQPQDNPHQWPADFYIDHATELLPLMGIG